MIVVPLLHLVVEVLVVVVVVVVVVVFVLVSTSDNNDDEIIRVVIFFPSSLSSDFLRSTCLNYYLFCFVLSCCFMIKKIHFIWLRFFCVAGSEPMDD